MFQQDVAICRRLELLLMLKERKSILNNPIKTDTPHQFVVVSCVKLVAFRSSIYSTFEMDDTFIMRRQLRN